ncbi:MAG TPA: LemA family protein [Candidatus Paenalcaligenes intestinipullorum]|uniref:LemA family protein n=1 Tax=Candidatus Paenalcaligenes intestinipullorum TaxID=2838718 RepID=A0A9D2RJZ9_9BURK|nr:LemA family protein [Candidatus Paenalcaligenes intestinipullorum]
MIKILRVVMLSITALVLTGCGYNEIQRLDEQVNAAWSQTLNQYERRADLVPKLVSSVNAYMVNERTVLTEVTEARSKVANLNINVQDVNDPALMAKFQQAQNQLSSALSRLIAVSENYPQLKSDGLFRDLMTQLEGTENRIATERGRYVQAVQAYNQYIRQFPAVLTAKVMGYQVKPNYGVDREDEIRRNPDVQFDLPTRQTAPAS